VSTPFGQGERCGEVIEKVLPGDFFGAERFAAFWG
jgi:hypothetical protein